MQKRQTVKEKPFKSSKTQKVKFSVIRELRKRDEKD